MPFIILDPFHNENASKRVKVCPGDCIKISSNQYYIDPAICIDCGACVAVYHVSAIFDEYDLTPDQEIFLENAENFYGR